MNKFDIFWLNLIINLVVIIFSIMVGIVLTLGFQEIIWSRGLLFRVVMSTLWVIGLFVVLFKVYMINYGFDAGEKSKELK